MVIFQKIFNKRSGSKQERGFTRQNFAGFARLALRPARLAFGSLKAGESKRGKQNLGGFTLVELLVVTGIFSIVVFAISGIFTAAVSTQKDILSAKKVLGEMNYAMEFMSRALRMATKDTGQGCIISGFNYDSHSSYGDRGIVFRNTLQEGECQEFYLDPTTKQIKFKRHDSGETLDLTSSDVEINELRFLLFGQDQADDFQPLVTIYFEASSGNSPMIKMQTSVSQRNLDVTY